MTAYSAFFLGSSPTIVQLELMELTHPKFSQTFRLVRNAVNGVTVTHEGGAGPFAYTYLPMRIKPLGSQTDLDQELEITIGDLGDIIPAELDRVATGNAFFIKPSLVYRTYRSDDLTTPLFGPFTFRVDGVTFTKQGAAFKARAAQFNQTRTGDTYRIERFPMLEPLA
jgi:hypothetical protein